jgi:hypothetical protein
MFDFFSFQKGVSSRPHGPAEGTQKVWKGSPEGKLFQKFPLWPPEAKKRPGARQRTRPFFVAA